MGPGRRGAAPSGKKAIRHISRRPRRAERPSAPTGLLRLSPLRRTPAWAGLRGSISILPTGPHSRTWGSRAPCDERLTAEPLRHAIVTAARTDRSTLTKAGTTPPLTQRGARSERPSTSGHARGRIHVIRASSGSASRQATVSAAGLSCIRRLSAHLFLLRADLPLRPLSEGRRVADGRTADWAPRDQCRVLRSTVPRCTTAVCPASAWSAGRAVKPAARRCV